MKLCKKMTAVWSWAVGCLLFVSFCSPLAGQVGRATVTGIVSDSTGARVPDVVVVARNVATGVEYNGTTNEVGNYTIGSLPVGEYSIAFSAQGFKAFNRQGINLAAGQVARIDVVLEVGAVAETLTVTAEAAMLETETAQTTEGVNAKVFSDLPLSFGGGRNMAAFADKLVPGVQGSAWDMKIQGTPAGSAGIIVDGMTNLAGFLPGDFGEASISPEAIQELNVQTGNVSAEYGRQSGGTLAFTLKSGTNDVHGS
ncbi:MAG TPA: TonB-dependent receptor, partial [Bryobacteraceae bacterium]|nr:TonB-dependent receptor [Bryobacteraceae bacterium]